MKNRFIKTLAFTLVSLLLPVSISAQPLNIVGSSTVYPFAQHVANYLTAKRIIDAPKFSVTGSGKGIALFCASDAPFSPDITNASRRMKKKELSRCHKNGVNVAELIIGYDGIVITQSLESLPITITRKALFLALAKQVPSQDGYHLIDNPYHDWHEIDPKMKHRVIRIYGPPKHAGTRDIIEDKIMAEMSQELPAYQGEPFHQLRDDGVFISDNENHKKDVSLLENDHDAIAIFGYNNYYTNRNNLALQNIDGIEANAKNISSMRYPLSRPLYVYVKHSYLKTSKDLKPYLRGMLSEEMIGPKGECVQEGLIPLSASVHNVYRLSFKYDENLSNNNLTVLPR
ncbi:MAG: substrate-binding domain-containing protein [Mariprofundaceae bacterium]|nr:substrate-binding domain-containing protein [Mariprofundaceae bacterium]